MGYNCSVPQCKSKWVKGKKDIMFHSFPNDKAKRSSWVVKIKSGKEPSKHARVCSLHFLEEDYETTSMGQWKILKRTSEPSRNLPVRKHDKPRPNSASSREERFLTRFKRCQAPVVTVKNQDELGSSIESWNKEENHSPSIAGAEDKVAEMSTSQLNEASTSDNQIQNSPHCIQSVTTSTQTSSMMYQANYIKFENLNDKELLYFSGFSVSRFEILFTFVSKDNNLSEITKAISPRDQLLLTLCKYRHNLDYKMLSFMFCITPMQTSKVFNMCTEVIYSSLKSINFWALGDKSPDKYRVIIDCTEFPIDKSENPSIHQLTFSQYKNRPTFKSLVGIDEGGTIIFCSDLYGGSTSDRQIVILSKFVDLLEEGDTVLADRGFEISDLLEKKKVALNIPPFLRGKKQLSEVDTMKTRKLANRRIHVERLIGLSKINNILRDPMASCLWPIANKIVYNCTMLCNIKSSIVKGVPKSCTKKCNGPRPK